jgi:hypothetical protein
VQPLPDRRRLARGCVALGEPAELSQKGAHRQVRDRLVVGQTLPHRHGYRLARQAAAEFRYQPRLAHARLAHQTDYLPLPRAHGGQAVV